MSMRFRRFAVRLIGLALLAVILLKLDLAAMLRVLGAARWSLVLVAVAANLLLFALKSWRWRELLHMQGIAYPWRDAYLAFCAGILFGLITPGRVGELTKALYLRQDADVPVSQGFANVLMDRLLDLYAIILMGAWGLIRFGLLPDWAVPVVATAVLLSFFVPIALLNKRLASLTLRAIARLPVVRDHRAQLEGATSRFQQGLRPLLSLRLALPIGLTAVAYLLFFAQGQLLSLALGLNLGFAPLVTSLSVSGLVTLLPVSISGLGTRDAALIAMFAPFGIGAEQAVAYSMLFFLTFYIGGGLIGAIAWQLKPLARRPADQPGQAQ